MKNKTFKKNPFLIFLPFLLLYIAIVIVFPTQGTSGDENRYLYFAHNLINGFFSPKAPNIDLGNGPGYPIILMPFVALHLPLIYITLLNAIIYYLSVVFLFKALMELVPFRFALIFSLFWALFYNSYENLPSILPEIFTSSLIPFLIYCIIIALKQSPQSKKGKSYIFLSGFIIGYLALTKPIFGYVIIFLLGGVFVLWLTQRNSYNYRNVLIILLIAFVTTIPYLFYTYQLTNKIFYWSSFGGNNLYWMSSPYPDEYGSWLPHQVSSKNNYIPGAKDKITTLHQKDFKSVTNYKGLEQDDLLKKIAFNNIISHPVKFFENCLSNIGRMLFNFPYSYKVQKPETLLRLPFNGIIVVLSLFCFIPTFKNWRKIDFSIRFLLIFSFVYFGGSILGSAETRMFTIILPILLIWIALILCKSIKVKLKFDK